MEGPKQDKEPPSGREVRATTAISIDDGEILTTTDTPGPLVARIHESISTVLNNGPKRVLLEIDALIASGDLPGAAQLLVAVHEQQETGWGKPVALCKSVARVPLSALDAATAMAFARARLELRHRATLFADAAEDAAFLLRQGDARNARDKLSLEMVVALGDYERGEKESATLRFRRFAEDANLDPIDRAWSLSNISVFLPLEEDECERTARHASDLFLMAGEKRQAASCLVRAVRSRLMTSPRTAAALIDEVLGWFGDESAFDQLTRGGMLQNRARVNLMVNRTKEALEDARASAEALRGLVGAERVLVSSLRMAVGILQWVEEDASDLVIELEALEARLDPEQHVAEKGVRSLFKHFDEDLFERLRQNPVMQRDASLFAHLLIAESLQRSGLSDAERVARLEKAQAVARGSRHQGTIRTTQVALARVLELAGQHSRALATLREIYDREPTCYEARWAIPRLLGILGRYREAARFFEDEMQRWGPSPALQCNYGHVLLRAGDADRAANILATVARDATVSEKLRAYASTWRDKALEAGGRLSHQAETSAIVLLSDVESVISDFSNYVKRAKRMEFWRRGNSSHREHRWTNEPERLAKNLFHTYVVSHFKAQVDAFEEVGAGAGRIDVYLRFEGGLAVLVELKMLGGGSYSSGYAWEGRKQLVHYMDNRRSAVGYLVVFDARQREWGKPPEPDRTDTERTIELVFVDVRPVVTE